jgi:regulator of protease activity HflC (stomatin/prohibitin superfamily)
MIFLAIAVPLVGVLIYFLADDALIRVDSGSLGLLVIKGRATDKTLLPGPHFIPAFRRMTVEEYPSLELSYRAGDVDPLGEVASEVQQSGPAVRVTLGDGAEAAIAFTVRFKLVPEKLRAIHERFGGDGIWSAVRDLSASAARTAVAVPDLGFDNLRPPGRTALRDLLAQAVTESLGEAGFDVTLFSLGETDTGSSNDAVQAAIRARLELEREDAEAPLRLARARNDAALHPFVTGDASSVALRYRENEVWRDLAKLLADRAVLAPPSPRSTPAEPAALGGSEPDDGEQEADGAEAGE